MKAATTIAMHFDIAFTLISVITAAYPVTYGTVPMKIVPHIQLRTGPFP